MAIYYQMAFTILVTEIALFLTIIIPLPSTLRKKTLLWISNNLIGKVQYTLKVILVFIFVLFIDSVNRMYRAEEENIASDKVSDVRMDTAVNTKKFYNQRNMYLTGATLFLSLVLNYTYNNIMDQLNAEEKVTLLEAKLSSGGDEKCVIEDHEKKISQLREELIEANKKVVDHETLKKQADQFESEYNRVADEIRQLQAPIAEDGDSKKDS